MQEDAGAPLADADLIENLDHERNTRSVRKRTTIP